MGAACSTAYFLVTHGSRDPRAAQGAIALVNALRELNLFHPAAPIQVQPRSGGRESSALAAVAAPSRSRLSLSSPSWPSQASAIGHGVLELGQQPLHQQIIAFVNQAGLGPGGCLKLLPLFLLPGVHVMEDIPQQVDLARQGLAQQGSGKDVRLQLLPYWGADQQAIAQLLQQHHVPSPHHRAPYRILMAHGSRRPQAQASIATLAQQLDMGVAYWVDPDSLTRAVKASPLRSIEVVPYFLFEGGITDAIAQKLHHLATQFPQHQIRLGPPLSHLPGFPQLVQRQLRCL